MAQGILSPGLLKSVKKHIMTDPELEGEQPEYKEEVLSMADDLEQKVQAMQESSQLSQSVGDTSMSSQPSQSGGDASESHSSPAGSKEEL